MRSWLILLMAGIYLYILFRRALSLIPSLGRWWRNLLPVLPAVGIAAACTNLFSERFMILLHFLVISLLVEGLNLLLRRIRGARIWPFLYRSSLCSLLICSAWLGYGYWNMQQVRDTAYTFSVPQLEEPIRLAFVSDVHMGTTMDVDRLARYCRRIAEQGVDAVLLGGDIVDESTSWEELTGLAEAFGGIPSTYGTYYIFGNHDSFRNGLWRGVAFGKDDVERTFARYGITVLEDETVALGDELCLIGRADIAFNRDSDRQSLEELLAETDPDRVRVVLDHQPLELERAAAMGVELLLSGHTHGGQIWPGGLISEWTGAYELDYGEQQVGEMRAIVSSGLGGWSCRFRTGSHSEIVYITLEPAANGGI